MCVCVVFAGVRGACGAVRRARRVRSWTVGASSRSSASRCHASKSHPSRARPPKTESARAIQRFVRRRHLLQHLLLPLSTRTPRIHLPTMEACLNQFSSMHASAALDDEANFGSSSKTTQAAASFALPSTDVSSIHAAVAAPPKLARADSVSPRSPEASSRNTRTSIRRTQERESS